MHYINMHYINNIVLTILIILLRERELLIFAPDNNSMEDLSVFASTLDSLFYNKPQNMSLKKDIRYDEKYVPTIVYKPMGNALKIKCKHFRRLNWFLKNYVQAYKEGQLEEYGEKNEFYTIDALHDMLITETKDIKTNKSKYIETNTQYAPLILLKYFENNEFIQRLTIELTRQGEIRYPMILFERSLDGTPEEYSSNWQNYFCCKYILDMEWYTKEASPVKKKITKYSTQQQQMYNIICNFLRTRIDTSNYFIETHRFSKVLNEYSPYEAVKKLNQQYREINNIQDKKVKLLKAQKNAYGYMILKTFNPDN